MNDSRSKEEVLRGKLFPSALGNERPTRPRSITIISYVLFASAGLATLAMVFISQNPETRRAADAASWLSLTMIFFWDSFQHWSTSSVVL